jgi:hypothetical protein
VAVALAHAETSVAEEKAFEKLTAVARRASR